MEFWPQTFDGIVSLLLGILALLTIAGTAVKYIWIKPIHDRIDRHKNDVSESLKSHGQRIGAAENKCGSHGDTIRDLQRRFDAHQVDQRNLHDNIGRLEGIVNNFVTATEKQMNYRRTEERDLAVKLGSLNTKVNMLLAANGIKLREEE